MDLSNARQDPSPLAKKATSAMADQLWQAVADQLSSSSVS